MCSRWYLWYWPQFVTFQFDLQVKPCFCSIIMCFHKACLFMLMSLFPCLRFFLFFSNANGLHHMLYSYSFWRLFYFSTNISETKTVKILDEIFQNICFMVKDFISGGIFIRFWKTHLKSREKYRICRKQTQISTYASIFLQTSLWNAWTWNSVWNRMKARMSKMDCL